MAYVYIVIGLLLLFGGAEALVRGAVGLARVLGLSPLVIGLVVISAGTSAPELVIALQAVLNAKPDIAVGNVIGSNVSNALLILGVCAMIRPLPTAPKVVLRDGGAMVLASIAFLVMAWSGKITAFEGLILVVGLIAFMIMSFVAEWRMPTTHSVLTARATRHEETRTNPGAALFLIILGCVLLYFGSVFVIDGGVAVARLFGMPEALVALTAIAIGTSLPELAATAVAAAQGETELAVGNLVGSSIFNILGVTGITALVHSIAVSDVLAHQDAVIMAGSAVLLIPFLITGWKISRLEGAMLFVGYGVYIGFLAWRQGLLAF